MKKLFYLLLLTLFVFTSCEQEDDIDLNTMDKPSLVTICKYNKGSNTWETISVNEKAVKAFLAQGAILGDCSLRKTYIPDNDFEQILIDKHLDDVLDDYVLTASIDTVTKLSLPWDDGIHDIAYITGIEDFISLREFSFGGTLHTSFDFSSLQDLESLTILETEFIETIDLTYNLALEKLRLGRGYGPMSLISLDLSKNKALRELSIEFAPNFVTLDLSKNKKLTDLYLEFIPLTSLDLSKNTKLADLYLGSFEITTLDLSQNSDLINLTLSDQNHLTSLNLNNNNNTAILSLYVNAEILTCFQVDDAAWSAANWSSEFIYSENCY